MTAKHMHTHFSRRESQIMDVLYRLNEGGVSEVLEELDDAPSYNSIRVILGLLEDKGYVGHRAEGARYIYTPSVPRRQAARTAAAHLIDTFFRGSAPRAVATLLDLDDRELNPDEIEQLSRLIDKAKTRNA